LKSSSGSVIASVTVGKGSLADSACSRNENNRAELVPLQVYSAITTPTLETVCSCVHRFANTPHNRVQYNHNPGLASHHANVASSQQPRHNVALNRKVCVLASVEPTKGRKIQRNADLTMSRLVRDSSLPAAIFWFFLRCIAAICVGFICGPLRCPYCHQSTTRTPRPVNSAEQQVTARGRAQRDEISGCNSNLVIVSHHAEGQSGGTWWMFWGITIRPGYLQPVQAVASGQDTTKGPSRSTSASEARKVSKTL
jgi:hypothetical protein